MSGTPELSDESLRHFARIREDFTRMMLGYRFGMEQVATRLDILREEFTELHQDNPIEHISSRLKSPESIIAKAARQGVELEIEACAQASPTSPASASCAPSSPTSTASSIPSPTSRTSPCSR